jgi:S-(hydroxymethyl)mycothiol dehydrogenase
MSIFQRFMRRDSTAIVKAMHARAVIVRTPGAPAEVEEIVLDPPGPGEVLVRIVATGVCHTDLTAQRGQFTREFPLVLGHEAAGVVEAVGDGVIRPRVGDSVVMTWRAPCGACDHCLAGRPVYCAKPAVSGPRMKTKDGALLGRVLGLGTFASHVVVAAAQAVPVPADLKPEATCLIGCAVATGVGAALFAARVEPGASVAVFGCGAVGLSVIQGARLCHAGRIIAVDVAADKLETARHFGATDAVDGRAGDPAKRIRELCGGVRYAFEAVGIPAALEQAVASLELGGTCVLIGVPVPGMSFSLPMNRFFFGRATLTTTFGGDALPARDFPRFCAWYRSGALDLDGLVTRVAPLEEAGAALGALERGEAIRTILRP